MSKRFVILFLQCCFLLPTWAVSGNNKQWTLLTLMGNYGSVLYAVEPQLRLIESNNAFNQFLANASVGYKQSNRWEFWMGQTWGTTSQDVLPQSREEYRLWEQVVWHQPLSYGHLMSRTRLEERRSLDFTQWSIRLRERLWLNIPITSNFSWVVSNEIFTNFNRVTWIPTKFWDQNRAIIGVEQQTSPLTFFGVGYMNLYIFTTPAKVDQVLLVYLRVNLAT